VGVSAGPRSGPDGPRSELDYFFIFKIPFFLSVGNDRYYKPFIFCIIQIISVAGADTKYRFSTNTINTFCCSVATMLLEVKVSSCISKEIICLLTNKHDGVVKLIDSPNLTSNLQIISSKEHLGNVLYLCKFVE
jgi:hypothetical protein